MELLESDDPKNELLKRSARLREDLDDEVKLITERTEKIITNALIIGGALVATYMLVRIFSGSKSKRKPKYKKIKVVNAPAAEAEETEEPSVVSGIVSEIGAAVAAQATSFLLTLAREKLAEFLQAQAEKKSTENEHS
jgi:hypothetical protein